MQFVKYEIEDRIGYITLNRPEKRNALSYEVVTELKEAFSRASEDEQVKVVVLAAEGKAFCAGADLAYIQQLQSNTFEENLEDSNHLKELFYQIYTLNKVVIAQVQGHAIAGGCGLATVCDFVFSVPEAKFGYTEVRIGFIPAIVKVFLLRKIGEMKSKELLLTGELITASDASNCGLINKIVNVTQLKEEVKVFAEMLIKNNSGQSMEFTKKMIAKVPEMSLEEGLDYAARKNAEARATDDCRKGINSFLNKVSVNW
ncbi:enoyl-CoA hydratase/isomerase family protein [Fulvivirga sediminis]|uniref:Enoyl-CoA hydratase/isomerase family protein n=1 Tax=Fulvivirga sediminis TaxID=2803949 RepID=A0A937FAU2_9BACT|nr:enoyl-CoA hydratase/isomerase family protein [Fulvivirga sediminis]MBL3658516.1 enoyl-CoA hydratase/isomerase family protein [Fulvivirga sediminis]